MDGVIWAVLAIVVVKTIWKNLTPKNKAKIAAVFSRKTSSKGFEPTNSLEGLFLAYADKTDKDPEFWRELLNATLQISGTMKKHADGKPYLHPDVRMAKDGIGYGAVYTSWHAMFASAYGFGRIPGGTVDLPGHVIFEMFQGKHGLQIIAGSKAASVTLGPDEITEIFKAFRRLRRE